MELMITITTSNLNGIRAAWRKGMLDWVQDHTPDVWCMQEVRAPQDAIDPIMSKIKDLYTSKSGESGQNDRRFSVT
ncbi:exodeoxyribonuclease III, partial [Gardnerella vaginalis]